MSDDDDILDDLFAATAAAASAGASAGGTATKAHAGSGPAAEETTEDDRRFAELVAGESDLFTHAAKRLREQAGREAQERGEHASLRVDWPEDARTDAERRAFDLIFEHALQAERFGGAEDRLQHVADARARGVDLWPEQHLSGRDPRLMRDRLGERTIVAEAMVRQLGAAGHGVVEQVHQGYLKLPRLHQLALLMLAGDDRAARRAAASGIVRALPNLAERLVRWMEEPCGDRAEREGLALAAILDRQAIGADAPMLSRLATEVLLLSLRAPLTRLIDLAPGRVEETAAAWGPALAERQATPAGLVAMPGQPLSAEAVRRMRLLSAGIAPLPFREGRLSLAEPARRVAGALARSLQPPGPVQALEISRHHIDAQLEPVLFGIGLLLAGVERHTVSHERALLRAASHLGQQFLAGTTTSFEIGQRRRIDQVQRKRAGEVKGLQDDLATLLPRLDLARRALAKLGLDETGQSLHRDEDGSESAMRPDAPAPTAVVCPRLEVKTNTKTKEAVAGHEHMLGEPIALALVGDLPARRRQLIAEFPWASEVVDFILGDLVNRQTVTIRPVLLIGTSGSGKTHFARRFAHVFGLHLWSVDCGGADGSVFSGTDRRWHSAEPSHPFLAMSRGRQANPLMVLDELEKAPTRQDYGRLWDSLLPFLEPGSNGQVQDRCLQVPIDASHVNYIATANRIDTLPWPLRDRFRITQFPEPRPEHLPALVAPLLAQLAEARGLDPRFITPLDPEEQAFLARRWRGGSVRRLARLIEAIVNARERAMSQH